MKVILHYQLLINETCRRLTRTVTTDLRALDRLESKEGSDLPQTLDTQVFKCIAESVTRYVINKVSAEWEETKVVVNSGELLYTQYRNNYTECQLPLR